MTHVRNEVKSGEFLGFRGAAALGRERVKIRDRALDRGEGIACAVEPDDLAAAIPEFGNVGGNRIDTRGVLSFNPPISLSKSKFSGLKPGSGGLSQLYEKLLSPNL